MREASLDLTTSSATVAPVAVGGGSCRRASDSPPTASRRLSAAAAHAHVSRTRSGGGAPRPPLLSSSTKGKKKSLAKILFPPSMSAAEMVRRGRLGKFVSPKKVSENLNLISLFTRPPTPTTDVSDCSLTLSCPDGALCFRESRARNN